MKNKATESEFFLRVYDVVRQIPDGRVCSYGAIAAHLGMPRSARMVGWAMNAAHHDPSIPAQRVVNRSGLLTGKHHFPGSQLMQQILANGGVEVLNDQGQDFKEILWDPSEHLPLWENRI